MAYEKTMVTTDVKPRPWHGLSRQLLRAWLWREIGSKRERWLGVWHILTNWSFIFIVHPIWIHLARKSPAIQVSQVGSCLNHRPEAWPGSEAAKLQPQLRCDWWQVASAGARVTGILGSSDQKSSFFHRITSIFSTRGGPVAATICFLDWSSQ